MRAGCGCEERGARPGQSHPRLRHPPVGRHPESARPLGAPCVRAAGAAGRARRPAAGVRAAALGDGAAGHAAGSAAGRPGDGDPAHHPAAAGNGRRPHTTATYPAPSSGTGTSYLYVLRT